MDVDTDKRFQSNVAAWSRSAPKQALMLPYVDCSGIALCVTKKGEPNLVGSREGKKFTYHSQAGAVAEADAWFEGLGLKNDTPFVFIYGIGLGYYYDAISPWLKKRKERRVIFLEDDLAVIHKLLETERGTKILNDPQVQLVSYSDLTEDKPLFEGLYWNCAMTRLAVTALKSYSKHKKGSFIDLRHKISFDASMKNALVEEYVQYGASYYLNFYRNMLYLDESYLGNALFGKFPKVPAIICGAGPSLGKHLPLLKGVMDKALVFAGGSALNVLNSAGLQPHFGAGIDPNPAQFERMSINRAYEVPFFYRNRMFHDAFRMIHGPRLYITGAGGYDTADYFEEKLGIDGEVLDEGHNVVNFCVDIAHAMGCNPLIFVGMDLAYTGMKVYAPGVVDDAGITQSAILDIDDQDAKAIVRPDIYGKPTFTLWKWVAESEWLGAYSKEHPALKMVNCTEGGLGFPGIPDKPFEEVVNGSLQRVYELKDRVHGETQNSAMHGVTRRKVVLLMNKLSDSLDRVIDDFCVLEKDADRSLELIKGGGDAVRQSGLAALAETELAEEIGYKHVVSVFNEVYSRLLGGDLHEIQTRGYSAVQKQKMKLELSKKKFSFLVDVSKVNKELIAYAFKKLKEEKKGEVVPVQPLSVAPGIYLFGGGRLVINDEEAGVKVDVPFAPVLVPEKGRVEADLGSGRHTRVLFDKEWKLLECYVEKDGKMDSQCQLYYQDGSLKAECFYKEGKLHGPSSFWSREGVLLAESWYVDGLEQGKRLWYYPSGELYCVQRFKDGVWQGRQEYYYEGGQLKTLLAYEKGKLAAEPLLLLRDGSTYRHTITGER